jgi:hypothetical protein
LNAAREIVTALVAQVARCRGELDKAICRRGKTDEQSRDDREAVVSEDIFPKKPPWWKELLNDWYPNLTKARGDEYRAYVFLAGYDKLITPLSDVEPSYGLKKCPIVFAEYSYLKGKSEALGRESLIRVLRRKKPLPDFLCDALADLFDPDSRDERKLVIKFRSKNRRDAASKHRAIAFFIQERLERVTSPRDKKLRFKSFVDEAAEVFHMTKKQIYEAWIQDKKRHPQYHSGG